MEVKNFAISIQWGKGMHYFYGTAFDDINQTLSTASVALAHALNQQNKNKRGAKPTVHIWEHVRSIPVRLPAKQKPVKKRKSATKNQAT